ncbi:hypothetical protein H045_18580 [Pseudomonas poae RE*1-1-14]|uniref:hypothetical protein n=1 Tax=Pseudomonas poae TaxID=200451 RepID=UPI0002AF4BA5|nr:hypothetical protein [Pseudomonas poae]AGE27778.1 hypothetical protein H045_18580 [Pseudomonas poae RE*1-1-14]
MSYKFAVGMLAACVLAGGAHASDIKDCPAPSTIKSQAFQETINHNSVDGFKYTAKSGGKEWTGQTGGTKDDYLAAKYELKAETFNVVNGKLRCDYGGKTLVENGETAIPNLRLTAPQ